jgi:hypothetical protein
VVARLLAHDGVAGAALALDSNKRSWQEMAGFGAPLICRVFSTMTVKK